MIQDDIERREKSRMDKRKRETERGGKDDTREGWGGGGLEELVLGFPFPGTSGIKE